MREKELESLEVNIHNCNQEIIFKQEMPLLDGAIERGELAKEVGASTFPQVKTAPTHIPSFPLSTCCHPCFKQQKALKFSYCDWYVVNSKLGTEA